MAKILIDQVSGKPSGFLAKWRYQNVYVDDVTGIVTSTPVSGKEVMNQCLTEYKKTNRQAQATIDSKGYITEFCNMETHTKFTIKPQSCAPFAYTTEKLNAPECGYQEPIPEPANPKNPFGVPEYAEYRFFNFCDEEGTPVSVKIKRKKKAYDKVVLVDTITRTSNLLKYKAQIYVNRDTYAITVIGLFPYTTAVGSTRSKAAGQQLTNFCDWQGGKRLRIFAQDAYPFVYIEQQEDAACELPGYEVKEIEVGGGSPVILSYTRKEDKFDPIGSVQCNLSFICNDNFSLQELYTEDEREFLVEVYKGIVASEEDSQIVLNWELNETPVGGYVDTNLRIVKLNPDNSTTVLVDAFNNNSGTLNLVKGDTITISAYNIVPFTNVGDGINLEVSGQVTKRTTNSLDYISTTLIVGTDDINVSAYGTIGFQSINSALFYKECTNGESTAVTYTKTYLGTSQSDADTQKDNDTTFLTNGQIYANQIGICRVSMQLMFKGFIIPDSCEEPFDAPPYEVTISAMDGLGTLKNIIYPMPIVSSLEVKQSWIDVLAYCLSQTNLALPIWTICNLYEVKMNNSIQDDPLALSYVNPLRFTNDKGEIYNCYDVLTAVCKQWGAFIMQVQGAWHFTRVAELANPLSRRRRYTDKGFFLLGEIVDLNQGIRQHPNDKELQFTAGSTILINPAYKKAEVFFKYYDGVGQILNGDFEAYDGQNFDYWTKYGGINVSRTQLSRVGANNVTTLTDNYAITFNEEYNNGKYMQASPVFVPQGSTVTLTFNIDSPKISRVYFKVKVGDFYLANVPNSEDLEWVTASSIVEGYSSISPANIFVNKAEIKLPDTPSSSGRPSRFDNVMIVAIYGFRSFEVKTTASGAGRPNRQTLITPQGQTIIDSEYEPVTIDNVSLRIGLANTTDEDEGVTYLRYQDAFHTASTEATEVLFGDVLAVQSTQVAPPTENDGTRPQRDQDDLAISLEANDYLKTGYHSIYTVDKSYSYQWCPYGQSKWLPIGDHLAISILEQHQKPYRSFNGTFIGASFLPIFIFNLELLNGQLYMFTAGDWDLKYNNISSCSLVEIFNNRLPSTGGTIPGKTSSVNVPQNPNFETVDILDPTKIFFPQFDDTFV